MTVTLNVTNENEITVPQYNVVLSEAASGIKVEAKGEAGDSLREVLDVALPQIDPNLNVYESTSVNGDIVLRFNRKVMVRSEDEEGRAQVSRPTDPETVVPVGSTIVVDKVKSNG